MKNCRPVSELVNQIMRAVVLVADQLLCQDDFFVGQQDKQLVEK